MVFFCQVMSPHRSGQMSKRSQVPRIAPLGCSLIEVHRKVGRWVGRSFWVRSCLLITLNKCLKGHKSLGSLCSAVKTLVVSGAGPRDKVTY